MLRKGAYPFEYIDSWEKFNQTSLPPKRAYYCKLNEEDVIDADYKHAQKVWEMFEIKNQGKNHDLYVMSDTSLLSDVFENFRDKCIEIYGLDLTHFLSALGLAWKACLKKAGVNLELLTGIDMLLMVEEGIRGGNCEALHRYAKASNKYMKNYDKSIESLSQMYSDADNLYEWAMSQKLLVNVFKLVEKLSKLNERFIKSYNENSNIGCFLELNVEYPKKFFNLHKDLPFLPERKK